MFFLALQTWPGPKHHSLQSTGSWHPECSTVCTFCFPSICCWLLRPCFTDPPKHLQEVPYAPRAEALSSWMQEHDSPLPPDPAAHRQGLAKGLCNIPGPYWQCPRCKWAQYPRSPSHLLTAVSSWGYQTLKNLLLGGYPILSHIGSMKLDPMQNSWAIEHLASWVLYIID